MTRGGRPRREVEQRDSAFSEALKEHLRRVKDYTQASLAEETLIAPKTLSQMVKGRRTSGTTLRRDLRAIIKALHQHGEICTLDEANRLITKIPTIKELDMRDPEDANIIKLFETFATENEGEPEIDHSNVEAASRVNPNFKLASSPTIILVDLPL